jgi:ferric enterobactin receptor
MKIAVFTVFFLSLFVGPVQAQSSFVLSGKVVDKETGQALAYCSVALFKSQDSTLAGGILTNEHGSYKFENVAFGRYYIQTQYIGYGKSVVGVPDFTSQRTSINLEAIGMSPDPRMLGALNVTTGRQMVEHKIDRQVYRADKFLGSQGGTAVDVLKNTPSVTVNSDGDIRLRGSSGFLVLLNGKPVQADPAVILHQIPANTIENVEVITAPSTRFDPDGKAGIINITTKTAVAGTRSRNAKVEGGLAAG